MPEMKAMDMSDWTELVLGWYTDRYPDEDLVER